MRLILEDQIPIRSAIVIESRIGKTRVAMDNVRQIQIRVKKHAALEGSLVGAIIDVAVVIAIIDSLPRRIAFM